ncbi:MAG: DNA gyrase inhibitor YacG [Alphaproteobacteria bacterium]|nr:DNA gyrase inhibitor YacG [Alphaproteobacteria bacterium]MCB9928104.1 DNA gyrase inhibitor YacG [Alphaproteobacteria bacterium]
MTEPPTSNVVPLRPRRRAAPCPICAKPSAADYRPFCSKRCADIDLHKWLGEGYRVETEEPADGADAPSDPDGR